MDRSDLAITAEVWGRRSRAWLAAGVRLAALGIVVLGGLNLFAGNIGADGVAMAYRSVWDARVVVNERGVVHLADVGLIAAGALIAWRV